MPRITREYLEEHHADLVEAFRAEGEQRANARAAIRAKATKEREEPEPPGGEDTVEAQAARLLAASPRRVGGGSPPDRPAA